MIEECVMFTLEGLKKRFDFLFSNPQKRTVRGGGRSQKRTGRGRGGGEVSCILWS